MREREGRERVKEKERERSEGGKKRGVDKEREGERREGASCQIAFTASWN